MNLAVACADVGSIAQGNFGWAICKPHEPLIAVERESIEALGNEVVRRLNAGEQIALGFECPLFVPITIEPEKLTKARIGEGNRTWCAGAGSGALAIGLVQATWLLRYIKAGLRIKPTATLDWDRFAEGRAALFLWEAFVSRKAKSGSHERDARNAVQAFCGTLPTPPAFSAIKSPTSLSLIGAALLRTGWDVPPQILGESCLVIKAESEVQ